MIIKNLTITITKMILITRISLMVTHVKRDSDTAFKVNRSKVKVTRTLYSLRP